MKILQVNCVYKKGSTGKIVYDIHSSLIERGYESVVCYGRGERVKEPNVYKTCTNIYAKVNALISKITGILYGGSFFSTNNLIRVIKKESPDIVHLHCINGNFVNIYRLIKWLNKNKIKTLLTLHAEFMYTANCGHAYECNMWKSKCANCKYLRKKYQFFDPQKSSFIKMEKAFNNFNSLRITSVSQWLKDRASESKILGEYPNDVILNGIDTNAFSFVKGTDDLREKLNIKKDTKIILHVTANFSNANKGGNYLISLAKLMEKEDVVFVVVGYGAEKIQLPKNIIYIGVVNNLSELSKYYSLADLSIILSKRETFSLPVAESLCSGTPVVGFCAGAPEQIAIPEFSRFVDYGDVLMLKIAIMEFLNKNFDSEKISVEAKEKYGEKIMIENYIKDYNKLMEEVNAK